MATGTKKSEDVRECLSADLSVSERSSASADVSVGKVSVGLTL